MADPRWRILPVPFCNKWRHDDITAIVKYHLCVSQLPWFYQRPYYLRIFRFMSTLREIWILQINLTIWRQNDVILPHWFNQVMPRSCRMISKLLCAILVAVRWAFWRYRGVLRAPLPGRRKQKRPGLNMVNRFFSLPARLLPNHAWLWFLPRPILMVRVFPFLGWF